MRRKLLRTAVFLLFQLVVTFLLVELGLRVLRPRYKKLDALLYYASVETEYDDVESTPELLERKLRPFVPGKSVYGFVLNSRGFRTGEYTGPRPPGTLRVMALGDSFTFANSGLRYRKMWTSRLEEELDGRGVPSEVFSLGVPAVGPMFELRLWELEHAVVRPDLVVLAFFVGNDFTDERDHWLAPWSETLPVRWCYTYRLLRNVYRLRGEGPAAAEEADPEPIAGKLGYDVDPESDEDFYRAATRDRHLHIEWNRTHICRKEGRERFDRLAGDVETVLGRMAREVEAAGQRFVVMVIPDRYQLEPRLRRELFEKFGVGPEDFDFDYPQERLTAFFDRAGIAYLDLLPAFRERSREESLYLERNTHWNPAGNDLAAELLAGYLVEHRSRLNP